MYEKERRKKRQGKGGTKRKGEKRGKEKGYKKEMRKKGVTRRKGEKWG